MRQAVSIIVLYALINILSLLFNIISFSTDGKIDIGFPFIFIHLTSAKYDSTFPYNKLLIEPFLWDIIFLFTIVCLYLCCLKFIKRIRDWENLRMKNKWWTTMWWATSWATSRHSWKSLSLRRSLHTHEYDYLNTLIHANGKASCYTSNTAGERIMTKCKY